jgi:flagellar biosynthetic protein FlhB
MADQPAGEKSLPASGRKRQRAREEGNIARSQDLSAAVTMFAALLAMQFLGEWMFGVLVDTGRYYFNSLDLLRIEAPQAQWFALDALTRTGYCVLPIMLVLLVAGVFINFVQVGFLYAPNMLIPKFNKVNPFTGFGKFFSIRALVELVKSLLKLSIVGWVVWVSVRDRTPELLLLMQSTPWEASMILSGLVLIVWWRVVLAMFVLGLLDYAFQKWQYERDLMMTAQEAREESREMEGDPRLKSRIRQMQREMAMRRMMTAVPEAEVVVTNPTTYAVALRYDPNAMEAPVVVAKGQRLVAQRIREIAAENDVPIVERPELARNLFRSVELGQAVPEHLFRAVAEILAYVYQIDRRQSKQQIHARAAAQGA